MPTHPPSNFNTVSVKLSNGRTVNFPATPAMVVKELCDVVAVEENVPGDVVTLKFDGKILKRSKSLNYYGVMTGMVLKVIQLTKQVLQLHLKLPGNETVTIEIHNTSPLSVIQTKLAEAKSDLSDKILSYKIGNMELSELSYAYEDCLKDGEEIDVKVRTILGDNTEPEEEMGEADRQDVLNSFAASMTSQRKVDIVFSFDTTGSMYSLLETVRSRLRESVTRLMADIPNIQIGIMAHGDYCDEHLYVLRKHDLSADVADLVDFVVQTEGSGGEGNFACYEWVLRNANGLSWREDAAKALVIIGDVVPHQTSYTDQRVDWRNELDALCEKEVKVYGVQAQNYRPANSFYGYVARKSGGAHIKFQHFALITDMFLAVCYRESGDDQLQAYVDEVKNEGRMTEEMMDVMKQLEKKPEEEEEEEEKKEEEVSGASASAATAGHRRDREEEYVNESWWDSALDTATSPAFVYKEQNYWQRNQSVTGGELGNRSSRVRWSKRKSKIGKKGCSVM